MDKELSIHEDPLELIHVPKTDADTLTNVFDLVYLFRNSAVKRTTEPVTREVT